MKLGKLVTQLADAEKAICKYYEDEYRHLYEKDLVIDDTSIRVIHSYMPKLYHVTGRKTYDVSKGEHYESFSINVLGHVDRVWHHGLSFICIDPIPWELRRELYMSDKTLGDLSSTELKELKGYYDGK